MQRRNFPARRSQSILLYLFGLALALSLVFNGFLVYKQGHQRSLYDYASGNAAHPIDYEGWEKQISDRRRANQQQDSGIGRPTDSPIRAGPNAPPGETAGVQRPSSK